MGVTGYEVKMYNDIARIATSLEAQALYLGRIARALEQQVYGVTVEDAKQGTVKS